jgi:hypothetical protein
MFAISIIKATKGESLSGSHRLQKATKFAVEHLLTSMQLVQLGVIGKYSTHFATFLHFFVSLKEQSLQGMCFFLGAFIINIQRILYLYVPIT